MSNSNDQVNIIPIAKNTIMLIDDNQVDRELIAMVLEYNGYTVIALETADNFLEIIETKKPDMILLDIMMPETNGNVLLTTIRKKWSQIELPIIMVTSKSETASVVESLKMGANDYISKPIEFDIALRRIQTHLAIADLSKKMAKTKEVETINTMITTYNHEINNPLSIAIGFLDILQTGETS